MKKKFKLGIIGCGAMATSIVKGVVLSDFLSPKKIIVSDTDEKKLDDIEELGVFTCDSNKFVAENSEFLVLAVKLSSYPEVVKSLGGFKPEKVISVVTGLSKNKIKGSLGGTAKVALCAPNFPCAIGSGIIGIDMSDFNPEPDDTEFIYKAFDCLGTVLSIDESKFGAVTAIGAGGAVYAFMLIDALADAGTESGLSQGEAKALAVQSVLGAAEMAHRDEETVAGLVVKSSANCGNYVEGVKILEENGLVATVKKAVEASVNRYKGIADK